MAKKKARVKQNIPNDESKKDRFVRVVKPRINKAIKHINMVGFCASSAYEYTPEQVEQIGDTLFNAVSSTIAKFTTKPKDESVFDFNE